MKSAWATEWLHPPRAKAKPFLKWAGGKRRLVDRLAELMGPLPEDVTYFEPFLGSGALFFSLGPRSAVLSDANAALIESYRLVKDRVSELTAYLGTLPRRPTRDQYYTNRDRFNSLLLSPATLSSEEKLSLGSLFIWLNHTCFNGLYRVNGGGRFNVPVGSNSEPYIFGPSALRASSIALRNSKAELIAGDYAKVLAKATEGDRVYMDPPYQISAGSSEFTAYTREGFSAMDQKALALMVKELTERGVRVLLSNSSSALVRQLYKDFDITPIKAPRSISRDGAGRKSVKEVVILA